MAVSVVQQVTDTMTSSYGIGTTAISSAGGNTLVAFIGWNCVTSGTYIAVPSVCVSDSAGNLWQQVGISRAGSGITSTTRSAIWMTVNAQPVTWVSVGVSGYSASASWNITELSGFPQALNLEYSVSANSGGTVATVTSVSTTPGIGFTCYMSGFGTGQTITGPAGWTALTSAVAGTVATGCSVFPYWNPSLAAGTAVTTGTFGSTSSFSVVLSSVAGSASPPAQFDNRFPLVTLEAAFGANPGAVFSSLEYTFSSEYVSWTDLSTRVLGDAAQGRITAAAGRQYELQQEEAGEMNIFLDNHDGAFTPSNPGSPFYSNAINTQVSFQNSLGAWVPFGNAVLTLSSAFTFASAPGAVSVNAMLFTPDGVTTFPGAFENVFTPVNQNYSYSFSLWVYSPAGWAPGIELIMHWYTVFAVSISNVVSSATPVPAGQWTQVTFLNQTPPSGAAYVLPGFQFVNAPTGTFYIQEAGLVTGPNALSTGLVALETPVRLCAWWQGRKYPLWMGYIERWPQAWPDMPQWGFSKITATDAIAVCAATNMNSALIGDVLIDNPYAYLPCNEQYTQATVGATPSFKFLFGTSPYFAPADANGLIALNRAVNNQVTGTYLDGQNVQASTGIAMNFFGDNGTGMGATNFTVQSQGVSGPSMLYSDPGLVTVAASSVGFTLEFWFTWGGTTQICSILTAYNTPSSYLYGGYPATPASTSTGAVLQVTLNANSLIIFFNGTQYINSAPSILTDGTSPQHVVLVFGPASGGNQTLTPHVNGVAYGAWLIGGPPYIQFTSLVLGPGRYSYDGANNYSGDIYFGYNFSAGHLAVYPYQLPFSRILSHYQAGAAGYSGSGAVSRTAQILSWGLLGLKRGGYSVASASTTGNAEITQLGSAYQLGGSPANGAINSVAQSEGGQYFVKSDGTLTYLERVAGYNLAPSAILGDNATAAPDMVNTNPGISQAGTGGAGWSSVGGTVIYTNSFLYGQYGSLLFTPNSTATTLYVASPRGPVRAGGTYSTGAWVYTPNGSGLTFTSGFASAGGTTVTANVTVPGSSWTYVSSQGVMPAGVSSAGMYVSGGTGTASTFYLAWGALSPVSPEIPYLQDAEFDYDNTYLYNEVLATQQDGPNQLTTVDIRNTASQQKYFRRSALTFQSEAVSPYDVSDVVTWSLGQFSQPALRITSVRIQASSNPLTAFPAVLSLGIGDIVTVVRRPVGGAVMTGLGIIERVQYEIGSRYFYVTYQISPYQPANSVLCADTAVFDQPANTTLGW